MKRIADPLAGRRDFDIVVLGGGPAGTGCAIGLARAGVREVLVAEAGRYEDERVGESVPPRFLPLLDELGVREDFLSEGHDPCHGSCSSWGDPHLGYNDFLFDPHGQGWHLDRRRFDAFLARKAAEAGARIALGTRFRGARDDGGDGFRVELAAEGRRPVEVGARFVVDATGMRALFARGRGARRRFLDRLLCVYGFFELGASEGVDALTLLEAVEPGWWYLARLPGGRLAVAAASDPEIVRAAGWHRLEGWLGALAATRHLAPRLAGCRYLEGSLRFAPAPTFRLDRVAGDRWLAAGDAASAFDPISSQGIHKAISNGLAAAPAITARLAGDRGALDEYAAGVAARYTAFAENRDYFYGLEDRWPEAPFWRARRASGTTVAAALDRGDDEAYSR